MANNEHTIHFNNIVRIPRTRFASKTVTAVKNFAKKHTHAPVKNIRVSNDVNEAIWERGMNQKLLRLNVVIRKKENLVYVFTPAGKDLKAFEKATAPVKTKRETKAKETPAEKAEAPAKAEGTKEADAKPVKAAPKATVKEKAEKTA
ncbi:MAG: hypothetical protein AABX02_00870 [archaeon]|mgnify:CR=1 FL=1